MNYANGTTGKAAELGLALARICMPHESCPPRKVVLGIHPGVIRVAVTCYEARGPHSDQGGERTHHYALSGPAADELLKTFYDDDSIDYTQIVIEANRVVQMIIGAPLEESDETLDTFLSMLPVLETLTIEERPSDTE